MLLKGLVSIFKSLAKLGLSLSSLSFSKLATEICTQAQTF